MKQLFTHSIMRKSALLGIASICLGGAYFGYNAYMQPDSVVKLSQLPAGSVVHYDVLADGAKISEGSALIKAGKTVSLPKLSTNTQSDNTVLSYDFRVELPSLEEDQKAANALNMLVQLNPEMGKLFAKGTSSEPFSGMTVKHGDGTQKTLSSDWAGVFEEQDITPTPFSSQQTDLAFRSGLTASDAKGFGAISVQLDYLGDDSATNISDVRVRYTQSLMDMTRELSAVMVKQTQIIGMFFDANIHLDTQRKHQELQARAHKDYHPSEQMCRVGTFVRSVAHAESKAETNKYALNRILMNEYLAVDGSTASQGTVASVKSKIENFTSKYCDPRDANSAVEAFCISASGANSNTLNRRNIDIDYTRMIDIPLTLDIDFLSSTGTGSGNSNEADVVAMAKNLYFPNNFEILASQTDLFTKDARGQHNSRSFAAKMNVAHSSFVSIVGMKSRAPEGQAPLAALPPQPTQISTPRTPSTLTEDAGWAYMKTMMRDFGLADDEIEQYLGDRPSYYAQMEVLTKKMYQNSQFYTNLYDKPSNVKRIGASMDAIGIMHQRDRFESMLRREMLAALLLEEGLAKSTENVNTAILSGMKRSQTSPSP